MHIVYFKGIYICEHLLPDMCLNILYPQGSAWEGKEVVGVVGLAEQLGLGASASLTSARESSSSAFASTLSDLF